MTVLMIRGGLAVAAIAVAGCGGGGKHEHVYTAAYATRIASVRPTSPGWSRPPNRNPVVTSHPSTQSDSSEPLVVELYRKLARLVGTGEAGNRWEDDNKVANLDVGFYRTASDAHEAMAALNAFSSDSAGEKSSPETRRSTASATRLGSSG